MMDFLGFWTSSQLLVLRFFFFNDTATTEIYTLSLHDALPICPFSLTPTAPLSRHARPSVPRSDRKSTRLNSSHVSISYAVFCLKKKNHNTHSNTTLKPTINEENKPKKAYVL